jgi:DNA-binding NarL/FixJ family response regulator
MSNISIGVVDDHALQREGLEALLIRSKGMQVVGMAADGAQLKTLMSQSAPDVILMDIKLQNENGLDLTRWLRDEYPKAHVIILSNYDEGPFVIEAISAGAAGYLLKDCSSALLVHTIHAVMEGAMLFKKELLTLAFARIASSTSVTETLAMQTLTPEERKILSQVETGAHNRIIGLRLNVSVATVKNRIRSILSKLGVANRTEAVAVATRVGEPEQVFPTGSPQPDGQDPHPTDQ